jgi:hypothetical protein
MPIRTGSSESDATKVAMSAKESLEQQKLLLETSILQFRSKLEEEKLACEIRELQEAPRRARRTMLLSVATAALTAITTLIVASVGGYITLQVQRFADRQKSAETYGNLLENLGSTNVPARAGAVVGLVKFAVEDNDRSTQTITILVTQLAFEEDTRVLRVLIPGIVSIGQPALDEVLRTNRTAHKKYVNNVRALVAKNIGTLKHYSELANGKRGKAVQTDAFEVFSGIEEAISAKLDIDLLSNSEEATFQKNNFYFRTEKPLNQLLFRIAAGEDETFGLMSTFFLGVRTDQDTNIDQDKRKKLIGQIAEEALTLFNSSIVLDRLIRSMSGKLQKQNLESVALIFADWSVLGRSQSCLIVHSGRRCRS